MIRKEGRFYVLRSRSTGRVLGRHSTKKKAMRQETAIRLSKLRAQKRIPRRHGSR